MRHPYDGHEHTFVNGATHCTYCGITRVELLEEARDVHPEATCEDCQGPNVTWFAPSWVWNIATRDMRLLILCPVCFIRRAEEAGITPTSWVIQPEAVR